MRQKAPFKLLYNNDTTNTAGLVSPWHEEGEPFREEMLVASIEEVANKGVDCYLLSPGMGWVPWWQSQVEPDYYQWWHARTGLSLPSKPGYEKYVAEGGDMVQVLVDTCRKHGMGSFVSLRMNDVHHQEHYVLKNARSLVSCRFYVEHPEWHIEPDHPARSGYIKERGMDWAMPEVRAYKLAQLRELAETYDLAGVELDFLRDEIMFRPDGPDEAARVDIISDFLAQVRETLDRATGSNRRLHLCVRIPVRLDRHAEIGFDVRRMFEAGVDMFNLSGWFHTTQNTDVAHVRALVPDAAIYVEMTHSTSRYPHFYPSPIYGCHGDPRTSPEQFYTTTRLARARGADGMSLFNYAYYRLGPQLDVPVTEPPFHVLPRLTDPAFLERQGQYYMVGSCYYDWQLPQDLTANTPVRVEMDMLAQHPGTPDGRLRLHTKDVLDKERELAVTLNGTPLTSNEDASRFFGNPYDSMISPLGHRRAWTVPIALIKDGRGVVEVELLSGPPLQVTYIDIAIPSQS